MSIFQHILLRSVYHISDTHTHTHTQTNIRVNIKINQTGDNFTHDKYTYYKSQYKRCKSQWKHYKTYWNIWNLPPFTPFLVLFAPNVKIQGVHKCGSCSMWVLLESQHLGKSTGVRDEKDRRKLWKISYFLLPPLRCRCCWQWKKSQYVRKLGKSQWRWTYMLDGCAYLP